MESIVRVSVPTMDAILGNQFPVLDQGFIRVIDYMGGDESIVQAARVSYGKGTKTRSDDRGLIRYLMRHWHTTPFEMPVIKLHVRVPMDCWRQWIRHRMSSTNEYSTRYSEAIDACQKTPPGQWRAQSGVNKQGSGEFLDATVGESLSRAENELHLAARANYEVRLEAGVAREQARKDLPLSTYTEAYWEIDLHNLFHFLRLRMDSHAQLEIRSYANIIGNEIVAKWCPLAWEAFNDYRFKAISLSALDIEVVNAMHSHHPEHALNAAFRFGWIDHEGVPFPNNRERMEFEAKMVSMGQRAPWGD
jgi:thymidylate synthase (FAD)